ncbi:MAG: hypothetical protein KDA55_22565, partial [Planctomycetales bacterium]|nr:hypothetical protein [Planctomycetales bacterium]
LEPVLRNASTSNAKLKYKERTAFHRKEGGAFCVSMINRSAVNGITFSLSYPFWRLPELSGWG